MFFLLINQSVNFLHNPAVVNIKIFSFIEELLKFSRQNGESINDTLKIILVGTNDRIENIERHCVKGVLEFKEYQTSKLDVQLQHSVPDLKTCFHYLQPLIT